MSRYEKEYMEEVVPLDIGVPKNVCIIWERDEIILNSILQQIERQRNFFSNGMTCSKLF